MPGWIEINHEIDALATPTGVDEIRSKYVKALADQTGRNVICYYSGWLQKNGTGTGPHPEIAISDHDMNGFMANVYGLDPSFGLDLVLHTPGGGIEPTRAIVEYLYKIFGHNIRVVVPQIAMSAGTMIACASSSILMGKQSSLGPTDPQILGHSAMGVIQEVNNALKEIKEDPAKQFVWQHVFSKFPPAFISNCERAVTVSKNMVGEWLKNCMFKEAKDPSAAVEKALGQLMNYEETMSHSHHFLLDDCINFGLTIEELEKDQKLQDAVLSVHHTFMATFSRTNSVKIVENHTGQSWVVELD